MITKEIIETILTREKLKAATFAKKIGVNPTQIYDLQSGKTKKISASIANKIVDVYPTYRFTWLTGKDEIETLSNEELQTIQKDIEEQRAFMIPLVHIDSVGGVYSPNALAASEQYIERMIPFPDARPGDVAILQSGNSMSPTIPAGAILQLRKVQGWREYFGYGNDFVLWLSDDRRITKQVLKYDADPANYVTCHSYNPEAADEELPKSMIREVWKVVNVLINKGW